MAFGNQPGQSFKFDKTPTDTISDIAFSDTPNHPIVCCTSWDNSVTVWELNNMQATPSPRYLDTIKDSTKDAMLCCCFHDSNIYVGTATGRVLQLKAGEKTFTTVGTHTGIISGIRWCPNQNLLLTGSAYDYKLNFWDLRDLTKPASSVNLQGKCRCLDVSGNKAVVATSDNKISYIDLTDASKTLKAYGSKLSCPVTSIAISTDGSGYVAGGSQGVIEVNLKGTGADLIAAHRENTDFYSSNCIKLTSFPSKNAIISGGGNGKLEYFNVDTLKSTNQRKLGGPVTALAILPKQKTYAVATGNDWARGAGQTIQTEMTIRIINPKDTGG